MRIKDIINAKKTPETKAAVVGIAGKHKFNGNFNTESFIIERERAKKRNKKTKKVEESKEETTK